MIFVGFIFLLLVKEIINYLSWHDIKLLEKQKNQIASVDNMDTEKFQKKLNQSLLFTMEATRCVYTQMNKKKWLMVSP